MFKLKLKSIKDPSDPLNIIGKKFIVGSIYKYTFTRYKDNRYFTDDPDGDGLGYTEEDFNEYFYRRKFWKWY